MDNRKNSLFGLDNIHSYECIQTDDGKDRKGDFSMKKSRGFVGMLVMVLVFGVTVIGCDDGTGKGNPLSGKWYTDEDRDVLAFEITSAGQFIMGDDYIWDVSVSNKTAVLKQGGATIGSFDYSIKNSQMTITNGKAIGMTIEHFSPVYKEKRSSGSGGGTDKAKKKEPVTTGG